MQKIFSDNSNLQRHKKSHNVEKQFKCDSYNRSFHRRDKLQLHVYNCSKITLTEEDDY